MPRCSAQLGQRSALPLGGLPARPRLERYYRSVIASITQPALPLYGAVVYKPVVPARSAPRAQQGRAHRTRQHQRSAPPSSAAPGRGTRPKQRQTPKPSQQPAPRHVARQLSVCQAGAVHGGHVAGGERAGRDARARRCRAPAAAAALQRVPARQVWCAAAPCSLSCASCGPLSFVLARSPAQACSALPPARPPNPRGRTRHSAGRAGGRRPLCQGTLETWEAAARGLLVRPCKAQAKLKRTRAQGARRSAATATRATTGRRTRRPRRAWPCWRRSSPRPRLPRAFLSPSPRPKHERAL